MLAVRGNPTLLAQPLLALFGSNQCPARLILQTHDLAQSLRQSGTALIGGFHTPVEQEALTVLLRGPSPLVICPARSLENMPNPSNPTSERQGPELGAYVQGDRWS